jgi:hypothetical protein
MNKFATPVGRGHLVLAILMYCGAGLGSRYAQEVDWERYRGHEAGFGISYPATWRVIVAVERDGRGTSWEPEVLGAGELHKVTFLEDDEDYWPGRYQVRVLDNPGNLYLEEVYSEFDLSDLWDGSAADTVIADLPAKTWVRWQYDSLGREYLVVQGNRIFHLLFDENNGNDPHFSTHHDIYIEMTASLTVSSIQEFR